MKTLYIGVDTIGGAFNGVTIEQVANAYFSHGILLQFSIFRP